MTVQQAYEYSKFLLRMRQCSTIFNSKDIYLISLMDESVVLTNKEQKELIDLANVLNHYCNVNNLYKYTIDNYKGLVQNSLTGLKH